MGTYGTVHTRIDVEQQTESWANLFKYANFLVSLNNQSVHVSSVAVCLT